MLNTKLFCFLNYKYNFYILDIYNKMYIQTSIIRSARDRMFLSNKP